MFDQLQWVPFANIASQQVLDHLAEHEKEAKLLFEKFDQNHNGFLEKRELQRAMATLGIGKKQTKIMRSLWDIDGNKKISWNEFVKLYLFAISGKLYSKKNDTYRNVGVPNESVQP